MDCPIRHLGTEKAQQLYYDIEQHLLNHGVEMLFDTECVTLLLDDEEAVCRGIVAKKKDETFEIRAKSTIIATGRRGAKTPGRRSR